MAWPYELTEHGSDLALSVSGATVVDCLDAALRGFAAHVADVTPAAPPACLDVDLRGTPAELLVGLLDEAVAALDIEGTLASGIGDARLKGDRLGGTLDAVALAGLTLRGAPPKAATWHTARLDRVAGAWQGHVVLDL